MGLNSEKINKLVFSTLTILILLVSFNTVHARKKRYYNQEKNRSDAILILRSESFELASLAGLTPLLDDSLTRSKKLELLDLASEDLSDSLDYEGEYGEILEELEAEDDFIVSQDEFNTIWLDAVASDDDNAYDMTAAGVFKYDIMTEIMNWLGTPYNYGGNSPKGIDCSAFMQRIYLGTAKIRLPRTAREQIEIGEKIERSNLQFGDLIFFNTRRRPYVSHVGIYLGDDLFAHASSRYGVTIGSLKSKYYDKRLIGGARVTASYAEKHGMKGAKPKN